MKKSRFSEERITDALRLTNSGKPAVDMCRQIGVSEGHVLHVEGELRGLGCELATQAQAAVQTTEAACL